MSDAPSITPAESHAASRTVGAVEWGALAAAAATAVTGYVTARRAPVVAEGRLPDDGAGATLALQLPRDAAETAAVLDAPAGAVRAAFGRQLDADYAFIVAYAATFVLVALALGARWRRIAAERARRRAAEREAVPERAAPSERDAERHEAERRADERIGRVASALVLVVALLAAATGAIDWLENRATAALLATGALDAAFADRVARVETLATWKWGLLFATMAGLALLLWRASRLWLTGALLMGGALLGGVALAGGARPLVGAALVGALAVVPLGISFAWPAILARVRRARAAEPQGGDRPPTLLERERAFLDAMDGPRPPRGRTPCDTDVAQGAERAHSVDRFGLALSGGGIRSATFNLGLLQSLDELALLPAFDYLATVSGGGYVGSFWTAWRHRRHPGSTEPFPQSAHGVERPEIRHLREYGNFLSPRLGLLSYDTGRMLVAALSATLPALLATLSLLLLALLGWLVLGRGLLLVPEPAVIGTVTAGTARSLVLLGLLAAAVLGVAERMWRARGETTNVWYAVASLVGIGAAMAAWWYVWLRGGAPAPALYPAAGGLLPFVGPGTAVTAWGGLFAPAGAWLAGALVLVAIRWLTSRWARLLHWRAARAALDRVVSRLLLVGAAWAVVALLWIAGAAVWHLLRDLTDSGGARLTGLAGTTAAFGAAFRLVQRVLSKRPSVPAAGATRSRLVAKLPQILAYLTIVGMVLTVVALVLWLGARDAGADRLGLEPPLAWGVLTATLLMVLTLLFFAPNEVGLHSFYRARLARAYLGASNRAARRQTEEVPSDDVPLHDLPRDRPLHLVCCAANDLASADQLGTLHRGAESSVLSPVGYAVGGSGHEWPAPASATLAAGRRADDEEASAARERKRVPTLASAMTASAAAFNSHMGAISMRLGPAVTFLMTAFNLRLGLWLPHPRRFASDPRWYLPGLPFYIELFGLSRSGGTHVFLSDGAHFENLAIYELLRRRCRYIVASDCGADPDVAFDDLGNLVRRAREDFGIEIDIDLAPLRPGPDGRARQPMVAGDIHYPGGDTGVLLLFKPTLVGNEPVDVTQYEQRNAAFPHETTGDQFYDEAQWESYRRLGAHAGRAAFRSVVESVDALEDVPDPTGRVATTAQERDDVVRRATRVFARARRQWQPAPPGAGERMPRLVDRASELDALLQTSGCELVMREVYKEVDEIDRAARARAGGGDDGARDGAAAAPAAATRTVLPPPEVLAPSLHAIRRAILFMEEVYLSENLEQHYNHPLHLGVMNYFARWAYAPLFRMWWPLLKSLYTGAFTSFVERQFGLEAVGKRGGRAERVVTRLSTRADGFAAHCLRLRDDGRPADRAGTTTISYLVRMRYDEENAYEIQAAQLRARTVGSVLEWDASDFFVPPGLWGIGIGENMLDLLTRARGELFDPGMLLGGVTELRVRIPAYHPDGAAAAGTVDGGRPAGRRSAGHAARKASTDLTQMYRAAGFRERPADAEEAGRWRVFGTAIMPYASDVERRAGLLGGTGATA